MIRKVGLLFVLMFLIFVSTFSYAAVLKSGDGIDSLEVKFIGFVGSDAMGKLGFAVTNNGEHPFSLISLYADKLFVDGSYQIDSDYTTCKRKIPAGGFCSYVFSGTPIQLNSEVYLELKYIDDGIGTIKQIRPWEPFISSKKEIDFTVNEKLYIKNILNHSFVIKRMQICNHVLEGECDSSDAVQEISISGLGNEIFPEEFIEIELLKQSSGSETEYRTLIITYGSKDVFAEEAIMFISLGKKADSTETVDIEEEYDDEVDDESSGPVLRRCNGWGDFLARRRGYCKP